MALSRKEIIAVFLLITAVLNLVNACYFSYIVNLHSSFEQVAHQVVCVGSAYICLIYALSTWLYHSNYHRTRQEMRYVLATMLLAMIACTCVSTFFFQQKVAFNELKESMDLRLLFPSISIASITVSLVLSVICCLLMLVTLLIVLFKIFKSGMKEPKDEY